MPAVMMMSWPSATSAPRAIFGSNRSEMYAVTRTRNTIRAVTALREIVPPHVGPTSVSLMSLAETLADALGVGAAVAVGVGVGAALALADADWFADGVGEPTAEGLGVVGAGARRPSWVRLLLLMLTQPWGHCPPVRIS